MKKVLFIVGGLVLFSGIYYTTSQSGTEEAYKQGVIFEREKKEKFLHSNSQSPFIKAGKKMGELSYFPINRDYQVTAKVERLNERQYLSVASSDGSGQRYLKYAWLNFKLNDVDHRLLLLKPMFSPGFFLGFSDETSGSETYGAGRYLDIPDFKGDRIKLDFNLAYNPYCAYDPGFSCPFPPRDNILTIRIEAGEKDYN